MFTNTFSVQTQSTHGAEVTTDSPTTVDDTLTVNNHVYIATLLGYLLQGQIQSSYNLSQIYSRKAGGTLLEDLEGDLYALQSSVSTNTVNDTASVVNDVDLRGAVEKLDTADVPLNETAFHFHPYTYWQQIHAIQKYYDSAQIGRNVAPTLTGNFDDRVNGERKGLQRSYRGTLFGIDVFTSSKVVNTLLAVRNLLAHRNAFAFAIQTPGGSPIRVQAANWLENLGVLTVWDMINGVSEVREEAAVRIDGNNAFIAS